MKLYKRLLSAGTAMLCATSIYAGVQNLTVNAETYSEKIQYGDCIYYKQVDGDDNGTYDYIEITDCDESAAEVVIPAEVDGLPVKSIGDYAFYNCIKLTSIEIPESVTSIGIDAFANCLSLTSIEIPDGVTSIGRRAFYVCTSVESIKIGKGVTSIGDYVFGNCKGLTSIEIPNSVTSIGQFAFSECYSLTSIEIPDSVTSIGDYAFYHCKSLESITIYNSECKIYDRNGTITNNTIYSNSGPNTVIIYGYSGSTAQAHAEKYNMRFAVIGTVYGDANGDGKLTALDAAFIAKTLAEAGISSETISAEDYPAMDYNNDGKITASDASEIAKYLAEKALQK